MISRKDYNDLMDSPLDGKKGLETLNKLADLAGYPKDNFEHGSSLEKMLIDNPILMEHLFNLVDDELCLVEDDDGDDEDGEDGDEDFAALWGDKT